MTGIRVTLIGVAGILSVAVGLTGSMFAGTAYACSVGSLGSAQRQREAVIEFTHGSDLVLVGSVLDERALGKIANNQAYESIVMPEAVLAGEPPPGVLYVHQLAFEDQFCSGGPRIREGEKVLLALDLDAELATGSGEGAWVLHHYLGKVRIHDGEAVSQYADLGTPIGDPESLLRDLGASLHTGDEALETAVTAAGTPIADIGDGNQPPRAAIALLWAVVALAVVFVMRRLQAGC